MIRVEAIKIRDLLAFSQKVIANAQPGEFIPITMQRAEAQVANPNAAPENIALLVAYNGDELVGYFGILPILLRHGREISKVHWFTTWMVNPNLRGAGVGSALMQAALDLEMDYLIVGSKPARRVCQKFGFFEFQPLQYAVIDFRIIGRFNPISILLRTVRKIATLARMQIEIRNVNQAIEAAFEGIFGFAGKRLAYSLLLAYTMDLPPDLVLRQVQQITPLNGAEEKTRQAGFYRSVDVVNWMLAYPWVLQPGESVTEALDFYFTDTRAEFQFLAYQLYQSEQNQGYVTFQHSQIGGQRVLKTLDHSLVDDDWLLPIALQIAQQQHAAMLEINTQNARSLLETRVGRSLLHVKQRIYQGHAYSDMSPLGQHWRDIRLEYIDGDTPFT